MKKILIIIALLLCMGILAILYFVKSDATNPYVDTSWGRFTGTCNAAEIPNEDHGKKFKGCDYKVPNSEIPKFSSIDFSFENKFDGKKSLPLMASAMIDIDNDGVDEVFVSGGITQSDAIFKYEKTGFNEIGSDLGINGKPENTTTYGAVSFDLDSDGNMDLLLAGDYGVYWYRNNGQGFEAQKIEIPFNEKSVPVAITIGDVNRDGHADLFVSAYIKLEHMEGQTIFKDPNYGATSLMMLNNGDNTFKDVTIEMGLNYVHNTFCAVLVDIDNDGYLDLVVAHDTGEVRTYKNEKGNTFLIKKNPNSGKYAYPMGIAVGDYNNDGYVDFFFSNTGTSVPHFMARGDLEEGDKFISDWMLFKNNGDFTFTDVAQEVDVAGFEFSWGAIFEDFNLDGKQDLVVAENYVDFPPHKLFKLPGRFLIQRENGKFAAVEDQAGVINKNYAITPITSDFNQDGYPDLIFSNLNGKVQAHINEGGKANFIAFNLPENAKYAGTRIQLTLEDGSIRSDHYIIGEGLSSDQSNLVRFGLNNANEVKSVDFFFADGTKSSLEKPKINMVHKL